MLATLAPPVFCLTLVAGLASARSVAVLSYEEDGWAKASIENDAVRVVVVPEFGGKIESLRSASTGREFLWRNPDPSYRPRAYGASFGDYEAAGWEDCFPAVGAGPYPFPGALEGRAIPDHGELWTRPCEWAAEGDALRTWIHGVAFAYRFERAIRLDGSRAIVSYRVENYESEPLVHAYAAHPLLAVTDACRLVLPPGRLDVSVAGASGVPLAACGYTESWPVIRSEDGTLFDASRPVARSGDWAAKLFVDRVPEGWAGLHDEKTGDYVVFSWDPDELPELGVWLNRGGWRGDHNVAFEPCAGAPDPVHRAYAAGRYGTIPPGGSVAWTIAVEVGRSPRAPAGLDARGRVRFHDE